MKKFALVGFAIVLLGGGVLRAQHPAPQKEHEWLKQLAGEWEYDCEASLEPGKPPLKLAQEKDIKITVETVVKSGYRFNVGSLE